MAISQEELAAILMRITEYDPLQWEGNFTAKYITACLEAEHSGDCKKQPWTCEACLAVEYMAKAAYVRAALTRKNGA